jgi:hypothetical protein
MNYISVREALDKAGRLAANGAQRRKAREGNE